MPGRYGLQPSESSNRLRFITAEIAEQRTRCANWRRGWRATPKGVARSALRSYIRSPETLRGDANAVKTDELGLVNGTLDLLVMRTLAGGPKHGFAIARWIRTTSDDAILVEDRALYLALHRLEERGLVESEWGLSENNRRARFYQITRAGKRQLQTRAEHWTRYVEAVFKILQSADAPLA